MLRGLFLLLYVDIRVVRLRVFCALSFVYAAQNSYTGERRLAGPVSKHTNISSRLSILFLGSRLWAISGIHSVVIRYEPNGTDKSEHESVETIEYRVKLHHRLLRAEPVFSLVFSPSFPCFHFVSEHAKLFAVY